MAAQGIPVPGTTPDWDALIRILESGETVTFYPQGSGGQGVTITTVEELLEYAKSLGYEPVYTIRNVLTGFAQVSPADSTTTTDVVVRVGTQIATDTVTGVVSEFVSGGNVTFGLVTRQVATSAAMTLLISAIQAGMVPEQVQEDLITAADPFTIDGEHVVILIDEDGKVHYQKELLEAIRAKAVELGVFNQGTLQPVPLSISGFSIKYIASPLEAVQYYANLRGQTIREALIPNLTDFNNNYWDGQFFRFTASSSSGEIYSVDFDLYDDVGINHFCSYEISGASSNLDGDYYNLTNQYQYTEYRVQSTSIRLLRTGTDRGTFIVYALNATRFTSNLNTSVFDGAGAAVEGVTPNPDTASDMIDPNKSIEDIIPELEDNEISTASPTDDDLENELKWYAVNTTKDNIFEEGADESETDPSVSTDGDVSPDNKDEIEDLLKDLLKHILDTANDPDSPDYDPDLPDYPTVDVQDSGDTPPAEPPLISGSANGLWKIYNPTISEIHSFGSWLWDSSIIEQITRMFNNPIDAVIALHQIYCTPVRGAAANIMCGYLDSGVQSSYTVDNQYQTIDCGTVSIEEFYRTAVDYTKTKISLYLPFVGIVPLDASVVMGSQLQVIYRIDVLTGTCLAQVKVIKQNSNAVMYAFNGNCACQIPLTATTYTGMVSTLVGVGTAAISAIGGSAPGVIHGAKQAIGGLVESAGTGGIKQSGTFGANAGALGIRIPYVIITHPTIYDAYAYNEQYGYPSNLTVSLGSLSGYTRVKDVHLSGIPCTDDELEMIERLLKEGVIIN